MGEEKMQKNIELANELMVYLEEDESGYGMIRHPLITYFGYEYGKWDQNERLNTWLRQKQEAVQKAVEKQDWLMVLMLHEKPSRIGALLEYGPRMSDEEYFEKLGDMWIDVENLWQYQLVIPGLLRPRNRDNSKRRLMMDAEEQTKFDELPDVFTVYRGCGPANEDGWSWTLDREKADWFAERFAGDDPDDFNGLVLIGECQHNAVIAYLSRRSEEEILVAPEDVKIIDRIQTRNYQVTGRFLPRKISRSILK